MADISAAMDTRLSKAYCYDALRLSETLFPIRVKQTKLTCGVIRPGKNFANKNGMCR
jgi:hypothetical protein